MTIPETGKTIIDFYADWCIPCQMLSPILEDISETEGVTVLKVDIDDNHEAVEEFAIQSVPTMVFFEDGREIDRKVGSSSKDNILGVFA